jgi:hypothetical protein
LRKAVSCSTAKAKANSKSDASSRVTPGRRITEATLLHCSKKKNRTGVVCSARQGLDSPAHVNQCVAHAKEQPG